MISLSVGCGNTRAQFRIYDFTGGDINLDLNTPQELPDNFILASGLDLPFRSKSLDHVFSSNLLEHLDNPVQCVKECKRVGRSSSHLIPYGFIAGLEDNTHKQIFYQGRFYRINKLGRILRYPLLLLCINKYFRYFLHQLTSLLHGKKLIELEISPLQ